MQTQIHVHVWYLNSHLYRFHSKLILILGDFLKDNIIETAILFIHNANYR